MPRKELQKQIKEDVEAKICLIQGDKEAEKKFYDDLDMLQRKRKQAGLEMSDINFIERNIECSSELQNQQRTRLAHLRSVADYRTEIARMRREEIEKEREEKLQFEAVKWDIYKVRCFWTDRRYEKFKDRQKRIEFWMKTFYLHQYMKKSKWNFDVTLKILITKLQNRMKVFKIGFYFTKFVKQIAPTIEERHIMKFRNTHNLLHFFMEHKAHKQSRLYIKQFLTDCFDRKTVTEKFRFYQTCKEPIERFFASLRPKREGRKVRLEVQFEVERIKMVKYYQDKKKKTKQMKQTITELSTIREKKMERVLDVYNNYYYWNLIQKNVITHHAMTDVIRIHNGVPLKLKREGCTICRNKL